MTVQAGVIVDNIVKLFCVCVREREHPNACMFVFASGFAWVRVHAREPL